jgi:L-asparaginase
VNAEEQRRVVLFGLGGTIAMSRSAGGGVAPTLSAQDLVHAVPGLAGTGIGVEVVDFRRLPGASLDFSTLAELTNAVAGAIDGGAIGAVITQGTDTIEETSFLLDLYHDHAAPLVITGAMRNPTTAGADGPANLLAAVLTAADADARDYGVLVVLNDEIHAARDVRKTHTTTLNSFRSPGGGPLGHVVEGNVHLRGPRPQRLSLGSPQPDTNPKIALHMVVLGDDPVLLAAQTAHIDGLVIAAMGAGHVPENLVETLAKAATEMPVILASRTGAGSVLRNTYGFPGSERDLIDHGLIPAGRLDPLKARILLACLLAQGAERTEIRNAFAVAGGYTDHWPWPPSKEGSFRDA